MKKHTKKWLLSALSLVTAATAALATAYGVSTTTASGSVGATATADFEMVDGAAIRKTAPFGLRFIAQMSDDFYGDLVDSQSSSDKKMGMFIVPYDYLFDASRYSNGSIGMKNKQYQNITTKIDHVFYDGGNTAVENKIYELNGEYYANGVISELELANYDREFVGIGYVAEEVNGKTQYTFAEFDGQNNVRSAVYVAIEAYEDYASESTRAIFNEYVWGAHLEDKGMTVSGDNYLYNGKTYSTITAAATAANVDFNVALDAANACIKEVGGAVKLTATITDGDEPVTFNDAHAVWKSSNEKVATVDKNGIVLGLSAGVTTISASFMGESVTCTVRVGAVDFEDGIVPDAMTPADSTESLSVVELNGNKVLKIQNNTKATFPAMKVTLDFLTEFFGDPTVEYLAFDAKTEMGNYNNFRRTTNRADGRFSGECYETDYAVDGVAITGVRNDAFKTFYFTRADYEAWVEKGVVSEKFISTGSVEKGDCIYIDNLRPVTQADYESSTYRFENGGFRVNDGGRTLLFYQFNDNDPYAFNMQVESGKVFTDYGFTNANVSDGIRAVQFTKEAGAFSLNMPTENLAYNSVVTKTGNWAVDIYVPKNADAKINFQYTAWPGVTLKQGAWTTVYFNNNRTSLTVTDTTGGTYAVDNLRSITEEEYALAGMGFEANASGLRDNTETGNVFYYYGGLDHKINRYSIAVTGGNGATISEPNLNGELVHGGSYSLGFTKTNGAATLQFRADNNAYAIFKDGFVFWLYSTVAINGVDTENFLNGNGEKFNGVGMMIPANTWTKVVVTADDLKQSTGEGACPFLRLNGSTAGTIYLDDFRPITDADLPKEEPETSDEETRYNVTVGTEDENGVMSNITFAASTHTNTATDVLPQNTNDTEDMSYIAMNGEYGLNDFLVFDFTGDNMPILSFFNTEVTNTIYNQEEKEYVKGWVVANGMTTMRNLLYGGSASAHANRIALIGPYKISYKFDDNGTSTKLSQVRASEGSATSPSPVSMTVLRESNHQYRAIVGWIENGAYMNLRMVVYDLSTGETVVNYNLNKSLAKADWEGDIALYGHFGRKTVLDNLYPVEEDTTVEQVMEKYAPDFFLYKGEWDKGSLTLAQSVYAGGDTTKTDPTAPADADMSYIEFKGNYGLNDYVVFDMTGNNMPIVSFFNNKVTNTVFNPANDANAKGWVWFNGLYRNDGVPFGGTATTNAHYVRLTLVGNTKTVDFDSSGNGFRSNLGTPDNASTDTNELNPNPLSLYSLSTAVDSYRVILGIGAHSSTSKVYMEMGVVNLVTGKEVYRYRWEINYSTYQEGSIALHGQFGKTTALDKVLGIMEDTTLDALMDSYLNNKDTDYSDEEAVQLDRYAYSSLSDGQWTLDGNNQVSNPTDYRQLDSTYETYANAGFNILLPQTMLSADGSKASWEASENKVFMDKAYAAGLKVILTDWHFQILSAPIKATSSGPARSDSTYGPWIVGTDANATSGPAKEWLDTLSELGMTADSTRFKTRDDLDKWVYDQLAPYKDHPAFYGVMLADEPSYHNAYCYGQIYQSLKRVMPEIYVQYNLLPLEQSFDTVRYRYPGVNSIGSKITNAQMENAYKQYVTGFVDAMKTDYIQYDDYPFKSSTKNYILWKETTPYVDNTVLANIRLVAEIAKERDLTVKVVTQSCMMKTGGSSGNVHIRQITEEDARWLNNYLLGFGVKQINYFTYWTKATNSTSGEYYDDGYTFVNRDGSTTALYDFMKTIMEDNTKFASTISHFDYNESQVFGANNDSNLNNDHISWSSELTKTRTFRWVKSLTTSKEYTLLTELYDAENYNYMYMVMNTIDPYYGGTQSVTVTFDSEVTGFYVYDQRGNRTMHTGNTYTVSLTAGQAVYLLPY